MDVGEDCRMISKGQSPIRVMRIIARMNVGGPAVQVSGLMRGLNSDSFQHRLYTGFCGADEADYLYKVAPDIEVFRIEGLGRRLSMKEDIKAFISLIKAIRDFKPHVIHTHTAKAGFLGRMASLISMQPSIRVHTFHGHLLNGYFGSFMRMLVVLIEKFLALYTHQLLAVGDKVRQDLLQAGIGTVERFGLMPPGLVLGNMLTKENARNTLDLPIDTLQCAFIGRVTQIKRPDRFLDVVSEAKRRGIDLDFFIAGDGDLLNACRERIILEDLPVKILGWQSDVEAILSAADIVIITSDNEGTPLSLIQAGMSGLPVVATNVGSIPEVVLDGITGIVTQLDVQEMVNALQALVSNKSLRTSLGTAGQRFTLSNFGINRLIKDHEELYLKLLSSRSKF